MTHPGSKIGAIAALVLAILVGVGLLWVIPRLTDVESYNGSQCEQFQRAIDSTRSLATQTPDGEKQDELQAHLADYAQQARDVECAVELPKPEGADSQETTPATTATEPTATEAPASATVAPDSSSAVVTEAPSAAPVDDSWTAHYFVLDNDPATPRNFGPAVDPATAVEGFRPRMEADPALLCANGGLIQTGVDGGPDCVRALTTSKATRDAYVNATFDQIADMHVETREPQDVETAYMVVGEDGIPRVIAVPITRTTQYHVLVVTTKDGRVYLFRLECGYQWDNGIVIVEQEAAPAPAPESPGSPSQDTPYTSAPPCVSGGDRNENGGCNPPSDETPPGSTPPGSTPPGSTTPTTSVVTTTTPPSSTTPSTTTTTTDDCIRDESGNCVKVGSNPAITQAEGHGTNNNDGSTDSQGRQDDPEGDAEEAASSAAESNAAQSSAASSAAEEADTDSGGGSDPHGSVVVDSPSTGGDAPSTGAAGEDTSGSVW